jgi:hypothetical protein
LYDQSTVSSVVAVSLLPFFQWCESSGLIAAMRGSKWLFPVIESTHLIGLALTGGAVLMVDLRLLGFGFRRQPVALVARDAYWWLRVSLLVMLPTGWLLFMASAVKCYFLPVFWLKMAALALALLFTFSVRRRVALAPETSWNPTRARLVAIVSLSLWSIVAISGRLVGLP